MDKHNLSRRELYDLVWTTPLSTLSKKYDISDNGLRKACKRLNIPLPSAGHWMKISFGKKIEIVPFIEKHEGESSLSVSLRNPDEITAPNPLKALIAQIKEDPAVSCVVPEKIQKPVEMIVAAKVSLTGKDRYRPHMYPGMVSCARGELDIRVAPKNVNRALIFMDTLIKALRGRAHDVLVNNDSTYVKVKRQEFRIRFREKMKRTTVPGQYYNSSQYTPLDILYFKYDGYSSKEWQDGKRPLESYLPEIIAKLEIASDQLTQEQQYHQKRWEELKRQEQLVIDARKRKQKELQDFKILLDASERWDKAIILRNYIDEFEKRLLQSENETYETRSWIEWARKKADWYDPFVNTEDELLNNDDKFFLSSRKE